VKLVTWSRDLKEVTKIRLLFRVFIHTKEKRASLLRDA